MVLTPLQLAVLSCRAAARRPVAAAAITSATFRATANHQIACGKARQAKFAATAMGSTQKKVPASHGDCALVLF